MIYSQFSQKTPQSLTHIPLPSPPHTTQLQPRQAKDSAPRPHSPPVMSAAFTASEPSPFPCCTSPRKGFRIRIPRRCWCRCQTRLGTKRWSGLRGARRKPVCRRRACKKMGGWRNWGCWLGRRSMLPRSGTWRLLRRLGILSWFLLLGRGPLSRLRGRLVRSIEWPTRFCPVPGRSCLLFDF